MILFLYDGSEFQYELNHIFCLRAEAKLFFWSSISLVANQLVLFYHSDNLVIFVDTFKSQI
jgi:hypothetical protein